MAAADPLDGLVDGRDELRHLRGCPSAHHVAPGPGVEPSEEVSRVEAYEIRAPAGGGAAGPYRTVRVTRCCDCAEAVYEEVDRGG